MRSESGERGLVRVLVAEDDDAIRMLLEDVLASAGYAVRTAPDGAAGLAILRRWRPDLIVLDLVMPEVDAPAFRAAQRGLRGIADAPVLLVSASRLTDLETAARDLGASAWLPKPFDVDAFLAVVAGLTAREGRGAAPPAPAPPAGGG